MKKLFTKSFFNFAFGFMAMLLLGLLGIVFARYVEWNHYSKLSNSTGPGAHPNQVQALY